MGCFSTTRVKYFFASAISSAIPVNDDSSPPIRLYARGVADSVLEGRSLVIQEIVQAGEEFGEVADENAA